MHPAYLFHNQGGGRFVEKAVLSGCGLGPSGARMAGMGVAAADLDGSGRPSLFITNFQNEPNVVFLNRGSLQFAESCNETDLGPPSRPWLGFGAVPIDADLDGNIDLAVANGHVHRTAMDLHGVPYQQPSQLFLGDGRGKFRDASAQAGPGILRARVGRGLAAADYDNDGRPDLAVSSVGEPTGLLRNTTETGNHWISLEIVGDGKASNRNAIGAAVKVEAGGSSRQFWIVGGGSYLSASHRRLLVGLGGAGQADRVAVRFPSGRTQVYTGLTAGRWWRLVEGVDAAQDGRPMR
jgi:hypothetical protein